MGRTNCIADIQPGTICTCPKCLARFDDRQLELLALASAERRFIEASRNMLGVLRPEDFAGRKGSNAHALISLAHDALESLQRAQAAATRDGEGGSSNG